MVGICVKDLVWIAVPPMVRPFLPQTGAIQIRRCNPIERESGDGEEELQHEQGYDYFWGPPLPWDGSEEGGHLHFE